MFHHTGIVLESARRRASLDAPPKRASFTDTRPNSTTNCWQILYFLIEREARPHPDLTPYQKSPALPVSLSFVLPCLPFPSEVNIFRFVYYYMSALSSVVVYINFVATKFLCRPSRVDKP